MKLSVTQLVCFAILSLRALAAVRGKVAELPTPLESLGFAADVQASRARAASSDARVVTSEVVARLTAENADNFAVSAEGMADRTKRLKTSVRGAGTQSAKAQQGAAAAAEAAKQAYISGTTMVANVEATAAGMVGSQIQDGIAGILTQLQDWKMSVLHNPLKAGRTAGMVHATPYDKALQATEQRVAGYEQRAQYLSNTARALRSGASGLADGAVGKQAVGDVYAAQRDMMKAHDMMNQATALETQGLALQSQAQVLAVNIPAYMSASATVSQRANYGYNNQFAPPPMAIGASAIMPPKDILGPPANIPL